MVGIYIHWPYCLSKCPYCDFNSHVREDFEEARWLAGVLSEIEWYGAMFKTDIVPSIFFGGGTPSLMNAESTAIIIQAIKDNFTCEKNVEITLEANPNTSEAARFMDFKNAGITRVSIGVQSFDDEELKFLGRKHSADEGIRAIENAMRIFDRVSFDLIYALPNQTLEQWEQLLDQAMTFDTKHLSLYQLTIEPDTPFEKKYQRKDFTMPLDDASVAFYHLTLEKLAEKGMRPYEVSNFSLPEEECRHNLGYWNYDDYVGIGPGAHGRFHENGQKVHTENNRAPETWSSTFLKRKVVVTEKQQAFERLMMGLRLYRGIDREPIQSHINIQAVNDLMHEGYLKQHKTWLIPTVKGILCHGSVVNYLLT